MAKPIDKTGMVFGKLTVVERAATNRHGQTTWLCHCECGSSTVVTGSNLSNGTRSCGCLRTEACVRRSTKHGLAPRENRMPEYAIWSTMKRRCFSPSDSHFVHYGARGITVCDRWRDSFEAFLEDMGPRPAPGLTLERMNNDGNYEPGNCEWRSRQKQSRNTRVTTMVEYEGVTEALADVCDRLGVVSVGQARWRINHGWSVKSAVERAPMNRVRKSLMRGVA